MIRFGKPFVLLTCLAVLFGGVVWADGGVTFTDIAEGGGAGITYQRAPSPRQASFEALVGMPFVPFPAFTAFVTGELGQKGRGAPGVALLDYDGDGDLDIYVTNGPGAANALYSNQLSESGEVSFVDMAAAAGVEVTDQDSTGVCFGDIDNDGDADLYVLGTNQANVLLENQGDGTFTDITVASGAGGDGRNAVSCSLADVDNDGLLDIIVANTYDNWDHRLAHSAGATYEAMEENYLFHNSGGNVFANQSLERGIEDVSNMTGPGLTGAAYTWALAPTDFDLDGDIDLLFADNQGVPPSDPSEERGWLRLFQNDGSGNFSEITQASGLDIWGGWMGLDVGDFNCDNYIDFFATDIGFLAGAPSRWFLGQSDGIFVDSFDTGVSGLLMTPFGWGASVFDYDNDGDADISYHGGARSTNIYIADNPGVILQNTGECSGEFSWDQDAVLKDHRTRMVQGMAVGDLDQDGFEDIVSVSSLDIQGVLLSGMVLGNFAIRTPSGGVFDEIAAYEAMFVPTANGWFNLNGSRPSGSVVNDEMGGSLSVELNSGDNGNKWAEVSTYGSVGILDDGAVNRDGIGAVVSFTPKGGKTSIRPIIGGSSYASQDALAANFGLGSADSGIAEVLWPGGVRNRLQVAAGERVVMPEIPCDWATRWDDLEAYGACVDGALDGLIEAGVLAEEDRGRYLQGAFSCESGSNSLCKLDDRFEIRIDWQNFEGGTGMARFESENATSGLFSFFGSDNWEGVVKVLDGCGFNNHYWVFASVASDVEYTITVVDTQTQEVQTYSNALGNPSMAVNDTSAFATCP